MERGTLVRSLEWEGQGSPFLGDGAPRYQDHSADHLVVFGRGKPRVARPRPIDVITRMKVREWGHFCSRRTRPPT